MADRPTSSEEAQDPGEPSPLGASAPLTVGRERRTPRVAASSTRLPRVGLAILIGLLALVLLALVPTVTSGLVKTPRDRVGISYGGGPVEAARFQRIVQPGSGLFWNGFFDPLYLYPADQQNYIISKSSVEGAEAVETVKAPSSDRVQVEYQVAVYFKLNRDRLQAFHEELGLKYEAYTPEGWDRLIRDTFRQQIENALQEETRRSAVEDLYGDAELLVAIQERVQGTLSQRLEEALGDNFFCAPTFEPGGPCDDPTFVVKAIDIPEQVAAAFEGNRTSQVQIETEQNQVLQRQAEAEGIRALSEALSVAGDDYVLLKAIESGKIDFWVLPNDSGVTLTAPDTSEGSEALPSPSNGG